MPGPDLGIHLSSEERSRCWRWIAGSSPATTAAYHRVTCADTASHFPFCFAQQSVYRPCGGCPSGVVTGLVGSETCLFPGLAAGPFGSRGMWPPASLIIEVPRELVIPRRIRIRRFQGSIGTLATVPQ